MTDDTFLLCPIEIREDHSRSSPGILRGVLLPYGEQAKDRREIFEPRSLSWPKAGVVLNEQHNRQAPIMMVQPVEEGTQVLIDAQLPDTQRGRDAATLVRDGVLTGLSVEFRTLRQTLRAGVRHIESALLTGAGLVDQGSYKAATVEMRRRQLGQRRRTARWL